MNTRVLGVAHAGFLRRPVGILALAFGLTFPGWGGHSFASQAPQPTGTGVATTADEESGDLAVETAQVSDPLERFNRGMFAVNEQIYRGVLRPLAKGYEHTVPQPVRRGLSNVFDNLRYPVRLVGAVLQAKGAGAMRESARFVVNTVAGGGGFVRVSDRIDALANEPGEDVGQALGKWGIVPGAFLVLPVFGPTTVRDLVGGVGDAALTPTYWRFEGYDRWKVRATVQTTNAISATPARLRSYDALRSGAIDPYSALRDAYAARRVAEIKH